MFTENHYFYRHPAGSVKTGPLSVAALLSAVLCLTATLACSPALAAVREYRQFSDVSAVIPLGAMTFAATSDESNRIRSYRIDQSGPVAELDLSEFLNVDPEEPESDIEGACRYQNLSWWITSHGRNKNGRRRESRCRIFALEIAGRPEPGQGAATATPVLTPTGKPYTRLLTDLGTAPILSFLQLDKAIGPADDSRLSKKEREKLAPKKDGLNIEGLAYIPGRNQLVIGLRNPLYRDPVDGRKKAILISIHNIQDMIQSEQSAVLGQPILLDLDKRGIRAIEFIPEKDALMIIAGPPDGSQDFALYRFHIPSGQLTPLASPALPEQFTPESFIQEINTDRLWIFSDDGNLLKPVASEQECLDPSYFEKKDPQVTQGFCPNKFLVDPARKTFRMIEISAVDIKATRD